MAADTPFADQDDAPDPLIRPSWGTSRTRPTTHAVAANLAPRHQHLAPGARRTEGQQSGLVHPECRNHSNAQIQPNCLLVHSAFGTQPPSCSERDREDRCALISPLSEWRLVWLPCGRPWCRSSRELGKGTARRAGIWSRAMWRGQPGLPVLRLLRRLRPEVCLQRQPNPALLRLPMYCRTDATPVQHRG